MDDLLAFLSLVAGGLLAVQAGANAQLSKTVGSPFGATTLQLSVGAIALAALAAATGSLVALGSLGVGLFVAGQMFASVALDGSGWLGVPAQPVGAATVLGSAAVLLGVAAIVLGQSRTAGTAQGSRGPWIALALVAGAALPVQGAVNGLLRRDLGAPLAVALVSFLVATAATAAILVTTTALRRAPAPRLRALPAMPWWGWLGGLVGATYVTTVFTAIPAIGAAATVGLTVAGQQVASVFVDRHGWFRLPRRPLSRLRLAGVAVLLVGVAVLKIA